jgi:dephospho-CoA kinase
MEKIQGKESPILLGITGGIASGKSTVARMLGQLGARLIDFDVLSRVVVETGKPAWKDITACFGEEVLQQDKTLNRKKLAEIVFSNAEKRKKLEAIIHPRIYEEFRRGVKEYSARGGNIIIQVVVPLLFEAKLQYLFHKILLVYTPQEMQMERLMRRDRVSREMARNMLGSQLPIEEKRGDADFVIDNSGSLEETKRQVEEVWEKLKNLPKGKER